MSNDSEEVRKRQGGKRETKSRQALTRRQNGVTAGRGRRVQVEVGYEGVTTCRGTYIRQCIQVSEIVEYFSFTCIRNATH